MYKKILYTENVSLQKKKAQISLYHRPLSYFLLPLLCLCLSLFISHSILIEYIYTYICIYIYIYICVCVFVCFIYKYLNIKSINQSINIYIYIYIYILIKWLILSTRQPVYNSFMSRDLGIVEFVVHSYLHFLSYYFLGVFFLPTALSNMNIF